MALERSTVSRNGRSAPVTAHQLADWDASVGAGTRQARRQPVPVQGGLERSTHSAVGGTKTGALQPSPKQRPAGQERKVMAQRAETAVRRANAGRPVDTEEVLHVHDDHTIPLRRQGRAPGRRAEGTPCVGPASLVAATREGRVPATSTLAWQHSRQSGPTLRSRSSSGARSTRAAHRQHRRRPRAAATSKTSRRSGSNPHASRDDWHAWRSTGTSKEQHR